MQKYEKDRQCKEDKRGSLSLSLAAKKRIWKECIEKIIIEKSNRNLVANAAMAEEPVERMQEL